MQNLSPILARQWWRHFRLSLYLSLSPSAPHAQYRKRFRATYNNNNNNKKLYYHGYCSYQEYISSYALLLWPANLQHQPDNGHVPWHLLQVNVLTKLGGISRFSSLRMAMHHWLANRDMSINDKFSKRLPWYPVLYWYYRKRFLYCVWGALGERERERQTEVTSPLSLKLAMSLHFPCQKFALGD